MTLSVVKTLPQVVRPKAELRQQNAEPAAVTTLGLPVAASYGNVAGSALANA